MNSPPSTWHILALAAAFCLGGAACASAQSLAHRYSFNDPAGSSNFIDSVSGADGALNNDAAANPASASLDGSRLQLDGAGGYAALPPGVIASNTNGLHVTIEFWASFNPSDVTGTRTFAFGNTNISVDYSLLYYSHNEYSNYQWLGYETSFWGDIASNIPELNGATNVHVTAILNCTNNAEDVAFENDLHLYNGATLIAKGGIAVRGMLSVFNDSISLLGRSLEIESVTLNGSIDEFRIYSGALAMSQIALNDASGPNRILNSPGILQALHFSAATNCLELNQLSPQALTGDFSEVTGLNLIAYGGAAFSSSDTNILAIDTNGVVQAIGPGTAEVVASFGGLIATNLLTVQSLSLSLSVVPSSDNLLLNWPLANASFSVETSSNLSSPVWITLTNIPSLSSSNTWQITIPGSGGAQFFRLRR